MTMSFYEFNECEFRIVIRTTRGTQMMQHVQWITRIIYNPYPEISCQCSNKRIGGKIVKAGSIPNERVRTLYAVSQQQETNYKSVSNNARRTS